MKYDDVLVQLLADVPEFAPAYKIVLDDFGDENGVGIHVVFGALFKFFLDICRQSLSAGNGNTALLEVVTKVAAFLEHILADGSQEISDLIKVSFMDHMWQASPEERAYMVSAFGPETLAVYRMVNG